VNYEMKDYDTIFDGNNFYLPFLQFKACPVGIEGYFSGGKALRANAGQTTPYSGDYK
jgi:hypothetical protein